MLGNSNANQQQTLYPTVGEGAPSAPLPSYSEVVGEGNVNPAVVPQYIYPQPAIIGVNSPCGDRYCPRTQIYFVDDHCVMNGNRHCIDSERRYAIRRKRRIIMIVILCAILIIIGAVTTTIIVVTNRNICTSNYDLNSNYYSNC